MKNVWLVTHCDNAHCLLSSAQQSCFTTVVMSEWQLRSSSWEHLPSGTLWSWKTALVIELNTAQLSWLSSARLCDCSALGTRLKIWLFVARCGGGIPEMLKDHKTHFPQRTKTLQQSSRLALVQSLHSEFMQLWVFGMFASNKFLSQILEDFHHMITYCG